MILADEKAKSILTGMRPERIEHGIRLQDVRHDMFDGDLLMRGRVVYPEKMLIDESVFAVR